MNYFLYYLRNLPHITAPMDLLQYDAGLSFLFRKDFEEEKKTIKRDFHHGMSADQSKTFLFLKAI